MREMKDSGIEWIGKIPAIWNEVPIRFVFKECTTKNVLLQEKMALKFTYGNIIPKQDFDADTDEYVANTIANYTVVHPGVIMINCLNLNYDFVSKRVGLVKDNGAITSAYLAIEPTDKVIPEYATYQLKSWDAVKAFHNMGTGVRKTLDFSELGKKHFVMPPLAEQHRIASFLDSKCSELDALSADIQKEIEILEQYKRSVITEAVTKGLNPNVEMKNSGIEWVGKIPKHWETSRIKYICSFQPSCNTHITDMNTVVSYAPMECIKNGYYIKRSICYRDMPKSLTPFQNEDIVMAKVTPCFENGNIAIMSNLDSGIGFGSSELFVFRATKMNTRYLFYWLQNTSFTKKAVSTMTGMGGLKRVSPEFIQNSAICVPPDSEQSKISGYLDNVCSEIATAIASKTSQLEVLDSYKKSLIYEYVTGKKEVPATN